MDGGNDSYLEEDSTGSTCVMWVPVGATLTLLLCLVCTVAPFDCDVNDAFCQKCQGLRSSVMTNYKDGKCSLYLEKNNRTNLAISEGPIKCMNRFKNITGVRCGYAVFSDQTQIGDYLNDGLISINKSSYLSLVRAGCSKQWYWQFLNGSYLNSNLQMANESCRHIGAVFEGLKILPVIPNNHDTTGYLCQCESILRASLPPTGVVSNETTDSESASTLASPTTVLNDLNSNETTDILLNSNTTDYDDGTFVISGNSSFNASGNSTSVDDDDVSRHNVVFISLLAPIIVLLLA